jgi:Calx-beta domain
MRGSETLGRGRHVDWWAGRRAVSPWSCPTALFALVAVLPACAGPAEAAAFEPDWLWLFDTRSDLLIVHSAGHGQQGGRLKDSLVVGAPAFFTSEGGPGKALVRVTRTGGSHGAASVNVSTSGGSAQTGGDFKRTNTRVRFNSGDDASRLVEIPIREDQAIESPEQFTVSLAYVRCAKLGKQDRAPVTIVDDDQPPPPPPANASFTFPGTATSGQGYEVNVKTQPSNPDQVCTALVRYRPDGTVPASLTTDFNGTGDVGHALAIDPEGRIVAAGTSGGQLALIRVNF